jgi:hypothetical protein
MSRQRVVIVGGGFGGVTLAQHLEHKLSSEIEIVLISSRITSSSLRCLPKWSVVRSPPSKLLSRAASWSAEDPVISDDHCLIDVSVKVLQEEIEELPVLRSDGSGRRVGVVGQLDVILKAVETFSQDSSLAEAPADVRRPTY